MAVSHVTSAVGATVTIPAVHAGDLLFATCYTDDSSGTATWTPPAGWSALTPPDSAAAGRLFYFYRWAVAGDSGTAHTFSLSAGNGAVVLDVLRGVDPAGMLHTRGTAFTGYSGSPPDIVYGSPQRVGVLDGGLALAVFGYSGTSGAIGGTATIESPLTVGGYSQPYAGLITGWQQFPTAVTLTPFYNADVTGITGTPNSGLYTVLAFNAAPPRRGVPALRQTQRLDGVIGGNAPPLRQRGPAQPPLRQAQNSP